MATMLLASFVTSALSYTTGLSTVTARLGYIVCLAIVEAKFFVILPFALMRVDLGSVEVHTIYVYYVNFFHFAVLIAVIMVVTFT
jgi:hypothetical protein